MYAIDAKKVCKEYYEYKVFFKGKLLTRALHNISFTVKKGDFFGLLGPNGAGKTSLISILTTNLKMTAGKVLINGYDLEKDEKKIRESISWSFGADYEGVGWSSVYKNMMLAASFIGLKKNTAKQRVDYLLKQFDLYEHRHLDVWRLSLGMGSKYSLAVAMLKDPEILFLDEPLTGLDIETKEHLRYILHDINDNGTTLIYTTHQLQEIEQFCKNVLVLKKGHVAYLGSLKQLKDRYRNYNVLDIECVGKNITSFLERLKSTVPYVQDYEIQESYHSHHYLNVFTKVPSENVLHKMATVFNTNHFTIRQINAGVLSLENIFKKIIDGEEDSKQRIRHYRLTKELPVLKDIKLLKSPDPEVREHACVVFWKYNKSLVKEVLAKMLIDSHDLKIAALKAIAEIEAPELMKFVHTAVDEDDPEIRKQAIIALTHSGDKQALDEIIELMLNPDHVAEVLEEIVSMPSEIQHKLSEEVKALSISDKQFLQYHIQRMKHADQLYHILHLRHKTYKEFKKAKNKK